MESSHDLGVQYTPSMFTKRFDSRDELVEHFRQFTMRESEKCRFDFNCHLNIAYGPTRREKIDIYGDDLPADSPLFIFIHGGYWQMEVVDKWSSGFVSRVLVENGVRVMVVDHEICPKVSLEEVVNQTKKCFEWIRDYVRKNSIKSLSICGHCAGAYLIACVLTEVFLKSFEDDVKIFSYLISGVYDLSELRHLDATNENNKLSLNDENFRRLSPQFYDFKHLKDMKIYLFVGESESDKFKQMSKEFAEGPLRNLNHVTNEVLPEVDHFNIVERFVTNDHEIIKIVLENAIENFKQ